MQEKIKKNINNPEQLEQMYQADKKTFKASFFLIYDEIARFKMAEFWKARLSIVKQTDLSKEVSNTNILILVIISFIASFLVKFPQIFDLDLSGFSYYERNLGLITLAGMSAYLLLTSTKASPKQLLISFIVFAISAIYINLLPPDYNSSSIKLAFIHLPLLLWCLFGLIFIDFDTVNKLKRVDYLKINGDLAIFIIIILVTGAIISAITISLFGAIGLDISKLYSEYIIISGIACTPIIATYCIKRFSNLTTKIAPIIASIFTPVVLITLVIYLISIIVTGGLDPYQDRNFLIILNFMLLGIMAVIVFSSSEVSSSKNKQFNVLILFILSVITFIVDLIALSATIYRIGEYGFTPNRFVALGANFLIFLNLILIIIDLYKINFKNADITKLQITIGKYLLVYAIWVAFVVFGLPLIWGFK